MNGIGKAKKLKVKINKRPHGGSGVPGPGTNSRLPTHTYDAKYSTFYSDDFTQNGFWNLFVTITYCRHSYF